MGVGFIQLITAGGYNVLTNKPEVTFFKNYYRRYSNFYINNYEINGNQIKNNSIITFIIPKAGDLLSKSFVNINFEEHFTELFYNYSTLNSTLNKNILNFYDNYSTRVQTFNKFLINSISIIKIYFYLNNINYFTIQSDNIIDEIIMLNLIKSCSYITLQTDAQKFFYNCNQVYNFYSFDYLKKDSCIKNDEFVNYLLKNSTFLQARVDLINYNLSFSLVYMLDFLIMYNFIISNIDYYKKLQIKIIKNEIYFSILLSESNNNFLYNFFNIIVSNIKFINLEIIDNKIKSTSVLIKNNVIDKIKKLFSHSLKKDSTVYFNIIYSEEISTVQIYYMNDTSFFGNFTNDDFNESLIYAETQLITITNLCTNQLPNNIFLRILISLVCNKNISIQEYLKITNSKNYDIKNSFTNYLNGVNIIDNKILDILINQLVLILSVQTFKNILYQYSIKKYYAFNNLITPFTDRNISIYLSASFNYYLYKYVLQNCSNKYNQTYNNFDLQLLNLLIYNKNSLFISFSSSTVLLKDYFYNYIYNNNFFNYVSVNNQIISTNNLSNNFNKNIINILEFNYTLNYITESITSICSIMIKYSKQIYQSNGQINEIIYYNNDSNSIFPLSSYFYIYTNNVIDTCSTPYVDINNYSIIFNTNLQNYFLNLYNNVFVRLNSDFNTNSTNLNQSLEKNLLVYLENPYITNLYKVIIDYYNNFQNIQNLFDVNLVTSFINELKTTSFSSIYNISINSSINLNSIILKGIFIYVDSNLYNSSFQNFTYDIENNSCSLLITNFIDQENYLNFIFPINSPIYRIYYLFTFITYLSKDVSIINLLPTDLLILQNFLLNFIIKYLFYFEGNLDISSTDYVNELNFDVSLIYDNKYDLINNFLCYDAINIFKDTYFKYLLSTNKLNNFLLIYNSFYFIKLLKNNFDTNINEFLNYTNNFKYNYDDVIIILLLNTLIMNKDFFNNFGSIYTLVNNFFKKSNLQYDKIVDDITSIILENGLTFNNKENFYNNSFYYNCYYTIFSVGALFDNTYLLMNSTINSVYLLTQNYNLVNENTNFFIIKNFNVKQYLNYFTNTNIVEGFQYFSTSQFLLFYSNNIKIYHYYKQNLEIYLNYITKYFSFLNKYVINEYAFTNALSIFNKYLLIFNNKNFTKINFDNNIYPFLNNNFLQYNIITLYIYYVIFFKECCEIDVNNYDNLNITYINFNNYLLSKYYTNIYSECLNDLINLLTTNSYDIIIDYSSLYFEQNNYSIIKYNIDQKYTCLIKKQINYINYPVINYGNNCIINNYENYESAVVLNSYENLKYEISENNKFFKLYNDQFSNFTSYLNKTLYSLYNGGINNKIPISNNLSDISLQEDFNNLKTNFYENSLYIIENNIYKNLYTSSNTVTIINKYSCRIVSTLLDIIKGFYNTNFNYLNTIFNKPCKILKKVYPENYSQINGLNILNNFSSIITFFTNYCNKNICTNVIFQTEFNRILYIFCTNYAITSSIDKKSAYDFSKNHTLYEYVRVYKISSNSTKKIYLLNTSLYDNIDIFQLFNYNNLTDQTCWVQNKWMNEIIAGVESFYSDFIIFKKFCIYNYNEIEYFKLKNGKSVIEYFSYIENVNELNDYIYNYFILKNEYSPIYIYNSIIEIVKDCNTNIFLNIDTDNIKKKIIIFIFINFLVFKNISKLLVKDLENLQDVYLEYNFGFDMVSFNLYKVINYNNNFDLLVNFIDYIFSMDNNKIDILDFNLFGVEYNTIIKITDYLCSYKNNFILLIIKYISSYNLIIGDEEIKFNNIISPPLCSTYTNLINRINSVYTNDINISNSNKYFLTINSIILLNINIYCEIYDLNSICGNKMLISSLFVINSSTNNSCTDISNINLLFNLPCALLKFYNIFYNSINDDVNLIIGNIRTTSLNINDCLEILKGIAINFEISLDYIDYKKSNSIYAFGDIYFSRSSNISYLSYISNLFNNLSVVTPDAYDLTINNINYLKKYQGIFSRYYLYEYNYYNFPDNYKVIYEKMLNYYSNILNNNEALVIIKKSSSSTYYKLFNDIINTIIANIYFNDLIPYNSFDYISIINYIINLYNKYNYTFRINKKINNIKNLMIQDLYSKTVSFSSFDQAYDYTVSYYYYELLSDTIPSSNISGITSSSVDLINFFAIIKNYYNYNYHYNLNLLNLFFKIEISIYLVIEFVKYDLNININYNIVDLNKIITNYLNLITCNIYLNNFIINYCSSNKNSNSIYRTITNIINYNDFITRLSKSFKQLLYYTENNSYEYQINIVWNSFFGSTNFTYYEYEDNCAKINSFVLKKQDFIFILFDYLLYIYGSNYTEEILIINITDYLVNIFKINNDNYIDINYISSILLDNIFSENINNINNINNKSNKSNKSNDKYKNNKYNNDKKLYFRLVKELIYEIFKSLTNTYWGIIIFNSIDNINNKNLSLQILLFNYYFEYIEYLNLNKNFTVYSNYGYDYKYLFSNNYKFQILYRIIIKINILQNLSSKNYSQILTNVLVSCNNYILYGEKILSFDLPKNIVTEFDFLNSNIFPDNIINNYYKSVQNLTIKNIIKYGVLNFIDPLNNLDEFTIEIYNNIIKNFSIETETGIGVLMFDNVIINILSNYKNNVINYGVGILAESNYISTMYDILINGINNNLSIYKNYLGGNDNIRDIYLTTSNLVELFNNREYEFDNKFITIFTLIYNQFTQIVNNDIVVILFYYGNFITWLMVYGNKYDTILEKLIYNFANLINVNILSYLNLISTDINSPNILYYEKFFNGLNEILFTVSTNTEYINKCYTFFNDLVIHSSYTNYYAKEQKDIIKFNLSSYNGLDKNYTPEFKSIIKNYNLNLFSNTFINNNKTIVWKKMLGIIVDFNKSEIIKNLKSIMNVISLLNIQQEYVDYIIILNNGIINKVGVLKMIEKVSLFFDDELIDEYNRNMYKIFINLFVNYNKLPGVKEMLGLNYLGPNEDYIINGLKPYIKNFKKKLFILPINLFFKDNENAIPLISCMYSEIKLKIYFDTINILKNNYDYTNLDLKNISTSLNMDFILLEREERIQKTSKQIDNLIEKHKSYTSTVIVNNDLLSNDDGTINLLFDFYLTNPIKELFWTLDFYINNYKLAKNNNYSSNSTSNNIYDFILNTKFYIDGSKRDGCENLKKKNNCNITSVLNPYKYNTRAYDQNSSLFNVYSFALEPESFQPTGALNFSNFNMFTIEITMDKKKLFNYINNIDSLYNLNNLSVTMNLNTLEYNWNRYQSGLAGLLFI